MAFSFALLMLLLILCIIIIISNVRYETLRTSLGDVHKYFVDNDATVKITSKSAKATNKTMATTTAKTSVIIL